MTGNDNGEHGAAQRERIANVLEGVGFSHAISRVYAALIMAPGEGLSTGQLVAELGISKAGVSNSMQFLVGVVLVERYRVPGSREAHYRVLKGVWGDVLARKFAAMKQMTAIIREAKAATDSPEALERLDEMEDVYSFFEEEYEAVVDRWNERIGR